MSFEEMKNEMDVWIALQRGKSLKIEDVVKAIYGVDVSGYIKTDKTKELKRYRERSMGCDGTAALTIHTLCEMIEPIINREVYDKEKGEPNGNEIGIVYYCSPITYINEMKRGKLQSGYEGNIQVDSFHINYTSEFLYK